MCDIKIRICWEPVTKIEQIDALAVKPALISCYHCAIINDKSKHTHAYMHKHTNVPSSKSMFSHVHTWTNTHRACFSLQTNGSMLVSVDKRRQKDQFRWSMKVISNDIYEYFMVGRECHHKFLYREMRQEYKTNSIKHWTWPPCQKDCV